MDLVPVYLFRLSPSSLLDEYHKQELFAGRFESKHFPKCLNWAF